MPAAWCAKTCHRLNGRAATGRNPSSVSAHESSNEAGNLGDLRSKMGGSNSSCQGCWLRQNSQVGTSGPCTTRRWRSVSRLPYWRDAAIEQEGPHERRSGHDTGRPGNRDLRARARPCAPLFPLRSSRDGCRRGMPDLRVPDRLGSLERGAARMGAEQGRCLRTAASSRTSLTTRRCCGSWRHASGPRRPTSP